MAINAYTFYRWFQPRFRSRRAQLFLELFQPAETTRILDVGGNVYDWEPIPISSPITVLNVARFDDGKPFPARFTFQAGDGRALPYADQSFDLVYSNSVIEHVGSYEDQKRFAREALRVGRRIFVQTPNRWFPVEPHFLTFFLHFFPKRIQRPLMPLFSLRGWFRRGDNIDVKSLAAELRLLSHRELRELFPGCAILREKIAGLTKSFIIVKT